MHRNLPYLLLVLMLACGACNRSEPSTAPVPQQETPYDASLAAVTETTPTAQDGANDVALWVNPADAGNSRILGSGEAGGIEIYSLVGERVGALADLDSTLVEVRDGFELGGTPVVLVLSDDRRNGNVRAFILDAAGNALTPAGGEPIVPGFEVTGLCLYRSPVTTKDYAFLVSGNGLIQQWELYDDAGQVAARLIRSFGTGFGSAHCAADDAGGAIYVSEETTGIWRIDAEPETDPQRKPVDMIKPFGQLGEEVKGLAVVRPAAGGAWLVASDASASRFTAYDLESGTFAGSFSVPEHDKIDGIDEAEGLHAAVSLHTAEFPQGVLIAADDDNGDEATNYKLVSWAAIAQATRLKTPAAAGTATARGIANVQAAGETAPVDDSGDAADDPAIWVHPTDPEQSVIIGAQKQRGLYVYDLHGKTLQLVADGRMNNVDLRYGFALSGRKIDIVAASNRSDHSISVYSFEGSTRRLSKMLANIPTGLSDPYGLCMYQSAKTGKYYVFINDSDGRMQQWELQFSIEQGVSAAKVREFNIESQPEGCVADDETGQLYVGEEAVGIWKYSAEPDGGDQRALMDNTGNGHLVADVEGMSIYYGTEGRGYLVVSCQGDNMYAVYRREGANEFVGYFQLVANPALGIDGASETDGLDVTSRPLGSRFPAGLFVAQDGRNVMPQERQNFKLAGWREIAMALQLE